MTLRLISILLPLWVGIAPAVCGLACAHPLAHSAELHAHQPSPPHASAHSASAGLHHDAPGFSLTHRADPVPTGGGDHGPGEVSCLTDAGAPLLARSPEAPSPARLDFFGAQLDVSPRSAPRAALARSVAGVHVRARSAFDSSNPPLLL